MVEQVWDGWTIYFLEGATFLELEKVILVGWTGFSFLFFLFILLLKHIYELA